MRQTREDMGVLLKTNWEMAVKMLRMQKRQMGETPLVPFDQERV